MRFGLAGLGVIAAIIGSILATPVFSLDSGDVNATITAAAPCVTLSSPSLTFPTKKLSTSGGNSISQAVGPTVTNCSGLPANFLANTTSASDGAGAIWQVFALANPSATQCVSGGTLYSANRYALQHVVDVGGAVTKLTDTQTTVATGVADGPLPSYKLDFYMPCSGSLGVGSAMHFTVTFTASIP